jgi:hypothetical protein
MRSLIASKGILPSFGRFLALAVALCYLGLAVLSAVCLFGVAPDSAVAHHHHSGPAGKVAHSPLCDWACQAGLSAVLIGFVGFSFALYVLFCSVTSPGNAFSQAPWASIRPRAPPFAAL